MDNKEFQQVAQSLISKSEITARDAIIYVVHDQDSDRKSVILKNIQVIKDLISKIEMQVNG